jgi:hypothetical protein
VVRAVVSPASSCTALQLQLCLVSCSPSKVGQFSFKCWPLSQRLAPGSTTCPALQPLGEVGLSLVLPFPCSQPLCFFRPLLGATGSSGRLACHPTPTLSLCAFLSLCWMLAAPLGGWFVTPLLLSAFIPLPISAGC